LHREERKEEGKLTLALNDAHDIVDRPRSAHKLVHNPPFNRLASLLLLPRISARLGSTASSDDNDNLLHLGPDAVPLLVPNSFPKLDQLFRFGEREGNGERVGFGAEAVVAIVVGRRVREREGERQGRGVVDAHERRGRRRLFVRVRVREGGGGFCRIGVERETAHLANFASVLARQLVLPAPSLSCHPRDLRTSIPMTMSISTTTTLPSSSPSPIAPEEDGGGVTILMADGPATSNPRWTICSADSWA
jgi:hypothetical protein